MGNFVPSAKVIADSIYGGHRLTTMEVQIHRFVLAELNTHRSMSRNSASSRAIPYQKMRAKALEQTAYPVEWPSEQRGMQGGDSIVKVRAAKTVWDLALENAIAYADQLHGLGVHKSLCNRILEPFTPHTVIVSATDWDGFWVQRCHKDAQPEIRVAAEAMKKAYDSSVPRELQLHQWHLPYISGDEHVSLDQEDLKKISVARCARVSYLTHDGVRDRGKDLELFDKLVSHVPAHASPLEHVATPFVQCRGRHGVHKGNFTGWTQFRHELGLQ